MLAINYEMTRMAKMVPASKIQHLQSCMMMSDDDCVVIEQLSTCSVWIHGPGDICYLDAQ